MLNFINCYTMVNKDAKQHFAVAMRTGCIGYRSIRLINSHLELFKEKLQVISAKSAKQNKIVYSKFCEISNYKFFSWEKEKFKSVTMVTIHFRNNFLSVF